jgi:hypothetical protein
VMMELDFSAAIRHARRAVEMAEQIGHRRAAMIAHHGLSFISYELGDLALGFESERAGLEIARALGARRFIGEGLMLQALSEFAAGDAKARETIAEGNAIARETPTYVLPLGLGLAAMIARSDTERAEALAAGEAVLAAGAVSHNYLFFNRYAIDACIAAADWDGVERFAAALERSMAEEPFPMTEFFVARARALAAAGRGRGDLAELQRLLAQARSIGWQVVAPALQEALAAG